MFLLLGINTLLVTYFNRREWRRLEEKRLPESVRRKLADRDRVIKTQQNYVEQLCKTIEVYSVAIRAAAMHNHKVAEILQMPLTNEVVRKRRAG